MPSQSSAMKNSGLTISELASFYFATLQCTAAPNKVETQGNGGIAFPFQTSIGSPLISFYFGPLVSLLKKNIKNFKEFSQSNVEVILILFSESFT